MSSTLKITAETKEGVLTLFIQNGDQIYPYFRTRDAGAFRSILDDIKEDVQKKGAVKTYLSMYKTAKNSGCISLI